MPKIISLLLSVSCAELFHDDRLRCREVPRSWGMMTVFMEYDDRLHGNEDGRRGEKPAEK